MKKRIIDSIYTSAFAKYCSFSIWDYFHVSTKNRLEQKSHFLNNKIENPTYEYKNDIKKLMSLRHELLKLRMLVSKKEHKRIFKKIYLEKLDLKINEVLLVLALKQKKIGQAEKYSKLIFGLPDYKVYLFCKSYYKSSALNSPKAFSGKYKDIFRKTKKINICKFNKNKIIRQISILTNNPVDDYANKIPLNKIYTEKDIKILFRKVLDKIGANKWEVKSDNIGFRLDSRNRKIIIKKSAKLAGRRVRGLLAHEIGVHLLKYLGGEKINNSILLSGFAGYEKTEEGFAIIKEKASEKSNINIDLITVFLGICYALGYEDGEKKSFRSTFNFLLWLCENVYSDKFIAETKAWNMCSRIFISPKWHPNGICFQRDHIYISGLINIIDAVKKNKNIIEYFNPKFGKIDALNKTHRNFAERIIRDQISNDYELKMHDL